MKIKYFLFSLLLLCALSATAQEGNPPSSLENDSKGIVYTQEFAMGLRLHTNGFAFGATVGKLKTYYLTKYMRFEFGELQHSKEYRQNFDTPSPLNGRISRAFKYGKQNNLYVLRGAMGNKRYFSEKAKHKGVALGVSYELGASLGLLKPYYLELRTGDGRSSKSTRYSEETAERFLDIYQVLGASSWTKGLGDISLLPGAHGKFAVHLDWGAFDEYVKSIEAGLMVDVFTKKAPIMVEVDNVQNRQLFLNLFVHLQFGKRW